MLHNPLKESSFNPQYCKSWLILLLAGVSVWSPGWLGSSCFLNCSRWELDIESYSWGQSSWLFLLHKSVIRTPSANNQFYWQDTCNEESRWLLVVLLAIRAPCLWDLVHLSTSMTRQLTPHSLISLWSRKPIAISQHRGCLYLHFSFQITKCVLSYYPTHYCSFCLDFC